MKARSTINVLAGLLLLGVATATAKYPSQPLTTSNHPSEALKAFVRSYVSHGDKLPPDTTTRINAMTVKTHDGKAEEYIVYLSGEGWCGSGGCTMLILEPTASSFRVLGYVTIVQLPVRVLRSAHYGHPDVGVTVQGGGTPSPYEAFLSFNGKRYPGNPSVPPARKTTAPRGTVVLATTDDSVPLYD